MPWYDLIIQWKWQSGVKSTVHVWIIFEINIPISQNVRFHHERLKHYTCNRPFHPSHEIPRHQTVDHTGHRRSALDAKSGSVLSHISVHEK